MKAIVLAAVLGSFVQVASADVSFVDNHVTQTIDCAKDPKVDILGNHATITLTGVCTKVTIAGNHATVTGSTATLWMAGNHNTASLDAVDVISAPGNNNTVSYRKTVDAKKKKPKISNPGRNNTVTKTK